MKKYFIMLLLLVFFSNLILAWSGTIWTTREDCGSETQDVNSYIQGEKVYIHGENFDKGNYSWYVKGLSGKSSCDPDKIVSKGYYNLKQTGSSFCFEAYTVNNDDCGEYKVSFKGKQDNYQVVEVPTVPEFSTIIGIATILGSVGIFFFVRR